MTYICVFISSQLEYQFFVYIVYLISVQFLLTRERERDIGFDLYNFVLLSNKGRTMYVVRKKEEY